MANRKVRVYKDAKGEHRWRLEASNGKTLADSAEGYDENNKAVKIARSVFKGTGYVLQYPKGNESVKEVL